MGTKQNTTYETDFCGWTQEQAAILRGMAGSETRLDVANLAEEIEDLGRTEIREVANLLRRTVANLIKLTVGSESQAKNRWFEDAVAFQGNAVAALSPGLKQRIDIEKIWHLASNEAARILENHRTPVPELPSACPLSLDDLLVESFDPKFAIEILSAVIYPANKSRV